MNHLGLGDRVRVDIPDVNDPDHERYHGWFWTVVEVIDDAPRTSQATNKTTTYIESCSTTRQLLTSGGVISDHSANNLNQRGEEVITNIRLSVVMAEKRDQQLPAAARY